MPDTTVYSTSSNIEERSMSSLSDVHQEQALLQLQNLLQLHRSVLLDIDNPSQRAMLLRFLRSTDFNMQTSEDKLVAYLKWRKEYRPEKITLDSGMIAELLLAKFHILGKDTMGHPVVLIHTRKHNPLCSPAELIEKLMVYVMEYVVDFCMDFPTEQFVLVLDHRSASFRLNFDLTMERRVLNIFQRYYPERLYSCLIIHSPLFVKFFVNNVLKPWIAPRHLKKVFFLDCPQQLLSWIPSTILPPEYGGTFAVDYSVMAEKMVNTMIQSRNFQVCQGNGVHHHQHNILLSDTPQQS
jgi:hypothetical protein